MVILSFKCAKKPGLSDGINGLGLVRPPPLSLSTQALSVCKRQTTLLLVPLLVVLSVEHHSDTAELKEDGCVPCHKTPASKFVPVETLHRPVPFWIIYAKRLYQWPRRESNPHGDYPRGF